MSGLIIIFCLKSERDQLATEVREKEEGGREKERDRQRETERDRERQRDRERDQAKGYNTLCCRCKRASLRCHPPIVSRIFFVITDWTKQQANSDMQ